LNILKYFLVGRASGSGRRVVWASGQVSKRPWIEEKPDYWKAKRSAILDPDGSMCLILDGMYQNATMIPKMRQTVKSMESWFVKTYLCGVFVHGMGLYANVWFNAHHLYDSNEVVMSIMQAIGDVQARRGNCFQFFESKLTIVGGSTRTSTCLVYAQLRWHKVL
jgi:hypothetical protein